MRRLAPVAALLAAGLVSGCSSSAPGQLPRVPAVAPLDRQQAGVAWDVYTSASLEHTWSFATAGSSIVGASPLQNRLIVFDPSNGSVTSFAPAASGGASVSEPLVAIAGKGGYVYFTSFQGSPVLGRFTLTQPPSFSYCTLPAAPTSALAQDAASGTIYVGDRAGYVDSVAWSTGACSVSPLRFHDPETNAYPFSLVVGWKRHAFLGDVSGNIYEISNGVLVRDYTISNSGPVPVNTAYDITGLVYDAKDDQIWFSSPRNVQIGRIDSNGTISYFYVAGGYNVGYGTSPQSIAVGPDGNIWAAVGYDKVWTVQPNAASGSAAAALTPPSVTGATSFASIAVGPDRQVYVNDVNSDRVYAYNYLLISTSVRSVELSKGSTTTVTVTETNYTGKLTATTSAPTVATCAIARIGSAYKLSLRGVGAGTATIQIQDSFGNSAVLPVTVK